MRKLGFLTLAFLCSFQAYALTNQQINTIQQMTEAVLFSESCTDLQMTDSGAQFFGTAVMNGEVDQQDPETLEVMMSVQEKHVTILEKEGEQEYCDLGLTLYGANGEQLKDMIKFVE